ncbi:hypothetical protein [Nostoc sp. ATCC 53789]|uniref:hypothetical protein n=1 Tax=Nostoc sp. ATCC 53789 TaxID=76335 RepID=UPI000DEC0E36|nr:hypothetical protein [Nostoc sp. ATCC 53789]QHG15803.1 hypothetical protein GJB62_07350 [Nostoc sp. ATCC 53789]RCJ27758.1 hypothetical protein A6V25_17820 [Nostoc sp. ATCC 53789]
MGITNAEADPRTKEEELESDNISRSSSAARGEISLTGTEQERVHREGSSRSSIFNPGQRVTGKMLDHLIGEYEDQVIAKRNEITTIEAKIKELQLLREELEEQPEE